MTKADAISDYELARLENIRKNEEFLKSLGLFKDPAVAVVHDVLLKGRKQKIKRRSNSDENDDPDYVDFEKDTVPVRRSTRNSGVLVQHAELDPDGEPQLKRQKPEKRPYNPLKDAEEFFKNMGNSDDEKFEEDDEKKRVVLKPAEIRSYIESINPEHSDMISNTVMTIKDLNLLSFLLLLKPFRLVMLI